MRSTLRAAVAGGVAGLAACLAGAGYIVANASAYPAIAWSTVGAVFVAELVLTGAAIGAAARWATERIDAWTQRRTLWAPVLASSAATVAIATPSAGFGADYFGSLHAPFMGSATIFAVPCVIAILLSAAMARIDGRSPSRALVASAAFLLPLAVVGLGVAASIADETVLFAFRRAPLSLLGAACGACLGLVFGLHSGLVVGATRALAPRVRVEADVEEEESADLAMDPLAEEEAELEARFAALERK
jgi:hypothetical protein